MPARSSKRAARGLGSVKCLSTATLPGLATSCRSRHSFPGIWGIRRHLPGLRRHGRHGPAVMPESVRVPPQGQASREEMVESGEGALPSVHGRRHFPQLKKALLGPIWLIVGLIDKPCLLNAQELKHVYMVDAKVVADVNERDLPVLGPGLFLRHNGSTVCQCIRGNP